jgi:murein DD-endopeptidase MepM/ murein hydrolase activator NlpD
VPGAAVDAPALDYLRVRRLLVPVAGVAPDRIPDSFDAPRGTRRHGAIDILAPRGTPVLSADDGRVLRLSTNAAGGITVYTTNPEGRLIYYYAHLERYHPGLVEGMHLARGDTLGYVGTTGNAPPDTPHLHFQVMVVVPGRKYWEGEPIDPIPYLVSDRARGMRGTR